MRNQGRYQSYCEEVSVEIFDFNDQTLGSVVLMASNFLFQVNLLTCIYEDSNYFIQFLQNASLQHYVLLWLKIETLKTDQPTTTLIAESHKLMEIEQCSTELSLGQGRNKDRN